MGYRNEQYSHPIQSFKANNKNEKYVTFSKDKTVHNDHHTYLKLQFVRCFNRVSETKYETFFAI